MADPVDILIVTESLAILRACMEQPEGSWGEHRLASGLRYWLGASENTRFAATSIEALKSDDATALLRELAKIHRPQFTAFAGTAHADVGFANKDIVLPHHVLASDDMKKWGASPAYEADSILLQEARYFESSHLWRGRGWWDGAPLESKPRKGRIKTGTACAGVPTGEAQNGAVQGDAAFLTSALRYAQPRLLVLCVDSHTWVDPDGVAIISESDESVVARTLAYFILNFLPEQHRIGNLRRIASPTAPTTNGASDDADLAPLMRELVENLRVTSITLTQFKNIGALTLDLSPAPSARGQWTCIAGVNGAGKSAVLQALVIALLGDRLALELGGDRLQRSRRLLDDVRHDASIEVRVQSSRAPIDLRIELDASGLAEPSADPSALRWMRALWKARTSHHVLRAYGPGRNLSEHLDTRYSDRSADVQAVMTLFDPLTQVASAEALIDKAPDEGFLAHIKTLADHVFQDLGVVATIEGGALRFTSQGAKLSVVDLPDGFRATLAWLADLCLAWYRAASAADREAGLSTMRATVLIDEIDLHLHPKLQRTLVPRLRTLLPRVQWIVTTHSPLVLACFDRSEIVMLERDVESGVRQRVVDRQIMGFTLDEIVEWLMETSPRSVALDEATSESVDPDKRLAFLLAMSPDVSERDAKEALAVAQEQADRHAPATPEVEPKKGDA